MLKNVTQKNHVAKSMSKKKSFPAIRKWYMNNDQLIQINIHYYDSVVIRKRAEGWEKAFIH